VVSGPIINPANGHAYYLLTKNTWTGSEAEATTLGGHLVTVNDAAENAWVCSTFSQAMFIWTGLNDAAVDGQFVWSSGRPVNYFNWQAGEPNNFMGGESYVEIATGNCQWNDNKNDGGRAGLSVSGVVEVESCESGTQFHNVLLPEILLDLPVVKVARLKLRFAPLGLNFTVQQPSEPDALCEARSNVGTLTMSAVLELPIVGQTEEIVIGYSTAQATLTLFQDGRLRWYTPGFDVTAASPLCIPLCLFNKPCSVDALTVWVTPSELGFSPLTVPFDTTVRAAEDLLHRRLSTMSEIQSCLQIFVLENPGQTDLLVTAPTGEQTGMTASGTIVEDILGAAYFPSMPLVFILNPDQGTYQTEVRGRTSGSYELFGAIFDSSHIVLRQSYAGSLDAGQTAVHSMVVPPAMSILKTPTNIVIRWNLPASGFVLESSDTLTPASWAPVPGVSTNSVTLSADTPKRFYRLRK
jgi:hypothetical protein